ncbi:AraC family transcriptional regulator [Cohnella zeiphila]|uniref:Helix-turn-helix transcriptional regulator n=1 Tax=Cohnella zeiphila TaxID=2761120 RepID=A0A7X0SNI6_9BACL|nr:AraC family transcriptional regulator [Cohnella zeiphila]MBB6733106.1 helix-turn-helix transcriptional regulator [Cohnella zeiphila]
MQMTIATPRMQVWRIDEKFENTPHLHEDQFQVSIPLYGACAFTHENVTYDLTAGEALVQYPQDRHSFTIEEGSGILIVQVDRGSLNRIGAGAPVELSFRQSVDPRQALDHFRSWSGEMFSRDRLDTLAVDELETRILRFLHRELRGSHMNGGNEAPIWSGAEGQERHLARVLAHIREHFAEPLRIDELAAIALQSRFHFIRSFKAFTGLSPYQYVLRTRIEDAKRRLAETDSTVTDIGLETGFSSPSQFYRAFFKASGMTPEQFRVRGGR